MTENLDDMVHDALRFDTLVSVKGTMNASSAR
jgi:hypothetical protein